MRLRGRAIFPLLVRATATTALAASSPPAVLSVGHALRERRRFTEEDVAAYAAVSGDRNPVHLDDTVARELGGFQRGRVVHGMLVASLFPSIIAASFEIKDYALGLSSDCWLAHMDRFLTGGVDQDEKTSIAEKMIKLVDLYYLALDVHKVNVDRNLRVQAYPHFMEKKGFDSYNSTSILGRIYDEIDRIISQQCDEQIQVTLPCFDEVEATPECTSLWEQRYQEYLQKSRQLFELDKEEKNDEFQKLYRNYKHLLYGAEEFEESSRDLSDVFMEACAIYRIVYERARSTKSVTKCRFVWNVAGAALCHLHTTKYAVQRGDNRALPAFSYPPTLHLICCKLR